MIRLTLLLLAGIAVTFSILGRDPDLPQGSDQPRGVQVARLDVTETAALAQAGSVANTRNTAIAIPLDDPGAALEAALRATEEGLAPIPVTAAPAADPEPVAAPAYWYVSGSRVNLRQGPSTATSVIGQVTFGQRAQVLEETPDGWFRIETAETGTTGFIYGKFLSPEAPL